MLDYTRSGTPDAPAIVFLHGMGMGQWMWHDQIQHFEDYDCYNVDLPGHGGSSAVAWESFDQAADCVAELIATQIPDRRAYVVGMSLGAVVAIHLMARHSERVIRSVLTGALAEAPPRWITMMQGRILTAILPTHFGKNVFARMLHLPAEAMPHYRESIEALSIPAFKRMTLSLADYARPAHLDDVRVPALFATGEKDLGINRRSVPLLANALPDAVGFYAPGLHHGWNGEDPDLFNAMTRAWIEGQPLPERLIAAG